MLKRNNQMTKQNKPIEEDDIDFIALAKTVWKGRRTIIRTILIFILIGLFIAVFSEKEYTASTTFVPQTSNTKIGGNLGGLAAMAGINLGDMGGESGISPAVYPQIINSVPFQLELLHTPLTINGQDKKITFEDYYTNVYSPGLLGYIKKYSIGLPSIIISAIKGKRKNSSLNLIKESQLISITIEENNLIKRLNEQLLLSMNDKDGYVSVSANMPEAMAAAELTKKSQELLQQYIINFKVLKSSEELKFIEDRYEEKEKEFKRAQQRLARFEDQNKFINSAIAKTSLMRLQSEYDLAFNVYSELSNQLEKKRLQVKEDTPVFTVLKPVTIPINKTKPNKPLILVIWIFIGAIVGVGIVFGRTIVLELKKKWNK